MRRPFGTLRPSRSGLFVGAVGLVALVACGGDDDGDEALRPLVDQIAPAMAAVDEARGGPQQYFEVNATPQFVNLFVADAARERVAAYLYVDGELEPPTPPSAASGETFAADAVTFDPDTILDGLDEDLADSDVVVFAVVADAAGGVHYSATVESARGGILDVALAADGTVLSADPRS